MTGLMTLQPHAEGWSFAEGSWQVDDQGVIVPPHNLGDENLAIYNEHAFGDVAPVRHTTSITSQT